MKKLVVWDLFGGGQNSVYNTLKEYDFLDKYDVYTFDVVETQRDKQFKLDLSQENIVQIFKDFPHPDIIVASPLCNSFSSVLSMKGGGTCFWKYEDKTKTKLIERSVEEFERLKSGFTGKLKADTQLFIKRLGQRCIDNTIELIKHYRPKYFYIENPRNSLMWKYIQYNRADFYDVLINGVNYSVSKIDGRMIKQSNKNSGMKGINFVRRGVKLPNQKNKKSNEQISEASVVSAIPHSLIKDIFEYFK